MKPKVEFTLVHEDGLLDDIILGFTTLEQIDSFIQTFVEMRDDLEEQIEREKQRRYEKRKRRKERKEAEEYVQKILDDIHSNVSDTNSVIYQHKEDSNIDASYDKLNEILKNFNEALDDYMEHYGVKENKK